MRKILVGLILFSSTFIAGWLVVPESRHINTVSPDEVEHVLTIPSILPSGIRSDDEFIPEFTNLRNFPDHIPLFKTKLVDVLEHGNIYEESEAIAKSGQRWLGLFERNGKFSLEMTRVKRSLDPSIVPYEKEKYVKLTFDKKEVPLFIVKNARSLRAGPVETVFNWASAKEIESGELAAKPLSTGYSENFVLNGRNYKLRVSRGMTVDGTKVNVLVIESNGIQQIVTYNTYYKDKTTLYDIIGDLLWAGDIDGDGKLDIYFDDFGFEKGGFGSNLFISSEAENGQLLKQIAWFGTSGC